MTGHTYTGTVEDWAHKLSEAAAAEERGDLDEAISLVSAVAECYSENYHKHNAHLWHMDLLIKAGRLDELAKLGETDKHAQIRLDRFLYKEGREAELRHRARQGDKFALYRLVKLLRERGERAAARQAAIEIDETDDYALQLADDPQEASGPLRTRHEGRSSERAASDIRGMTEDHGSKPPSTAEGGG